MAKSDLGTKRVCPETGRKFYDLNKTPVISPYTGKVVPIAPVAARARPEQAASKPAPVEAEVEAPEAAEVEMVSLEDADAEAQGKTTKKKVTAEGEDSGEDEDVEMDESLDDAAFIEEDEEGDTDVSDIIGDGIEKEEEG
ncbi:MAG TPA: TIGR02300 family protein [Pseudolabrys sp.]|nr:TIGR02300 family protein [Pseudolabrys sp.]